MSGSSVRRPRIRLTINGTPVPGCRSAEVVSRNGSQAASFRTTAAYNDVARVLGQGWIDLDLLSTGIDFGFATGGAGERNITWIRMITGTVDRVGLDQISGLVTMDGRDNAARLIDLPLQDAYLNTTSSELASVMAERCGLSADVDATSALVGQYYQIEHTKNALGGFSRHANAWDLLAELADLEGYDLWVDQTALHFKTAGIAGSTFFDVVYAASETVASPNLTISDLSMHRTLGLSGPIQVKVASWNSRQRRQVTGSYPTDASADVKQFLVLKPNLLSDQADALARTTYMQLRAHQRVVTGAMAGELDLTPRHRLRLSGTGTGWDGIYTLDRIERQMSLERGFVQHITARSAPEGGSENG